jgi:hypothetical protein
MTHLGLARHLLSSFVVGPINTAWEKVARGRWNMEFRWLALIALWTMLSGPIFAGPGARTKNSTRPTTVQTQAASATAKIVKP